MALGVPVGVGVGVGVDVGVGVEVKVGVGAAPIVNVTCLVLVQPFLVALRTTKYTPERVGVPVMFPVAGSAANPEGKFAAP